MLWRLGAHTLPVIWTNRPGCTASMESARGTGPRSAAKSDMKMMSDLTNLGVLDFCGGGKW